MIKDLQLFFLEKSTDRIYNDDMNTDLFKLIEDKDIEGIDMKVLTNGKDFDGPSQFIQICDKDKILNDKKYICHYEILYMGEDTPNYGSHQKDKIYVEIHFENKKYSSLFQSVVDELLKSSKLETFYWRPYCPGLRLKKSVFSTNDKEKILSNLKELKNLTLDKILQRYNDIFNVNKQWKSSFYLECGKQYSEKRALSEYYREPKEVLLVHEQLKKKLIRKIQDNNALVNPKDPIDEKSLSPENPVNIINYIDIAAKTKKGDIVFFEIKTATEARLCIRQALGQLMEYSFYPYENIKNAQKLIVVGSGTKTPEVTDYIKKLNNQFNIPIDYLQI